MPAEEGEGIQKRRGVAEADVEDPSSELGWGPRTSESPRWVFHDWIPVQIANLTSLAAEYEPLAAYWT